MKFTLFVGRSSVLTNVYSPVATTTIEIEYFHHPEHSHMPLGNPSPLLSQLLANAGLIPIPRVLLILGCHINGITISLVLLLHVEITFNLLIVLLNVPLGAGFSSFLKWR